MSSEFLLLNNLDKPLKFFLFTATEFAVIASCLLAGIFLQFFFSSIVFIIVGFILHRKFFRRFNSGAVKELMYFQTGWREQSLTYKLPSHMRRMIG